MNLATNEFDSAIDSAIPLWIGVIHTLVSLSIGHVDLIMVIYRLFIYYFAFNLLFFFVNAFSMEKNAANTHWKKLMTLLMGFRSAIF